MFKNFAGRFVAAVVEQVTEDLHGPEKIDWSDLAQVYEVVPVGR